MADVKKYGFVIDPRRCIDCRACLVACRAEWNIPAGQTRIWVHTDGPQGTFPDIHQTWVPVQCHHCEDPWCVEACPTGATFKRADGLVLVDSEACIGCGLCVNACPFQARFRNEVTRKADKCNGCYTRVDRGEMPACVATCVGGARLFGDFNDPASTVSQAIKDQVVYRAITEDVDTGPMTYYLAPPDASQVQVAPQPREDLAAEKFWHSWAIPLVKLAVGATFLGQAGAFILQLLRGENEYEDGAV